VHALQGRVTRDLRAVHFGRLVAAAVHAQRDAEHAGGGGARAVVAAAGRLQRQHAPQVGNRLLRAVGLHQRAPGRRFQPALQVRLLVRVLHGAELPARLRQLGQRFVRTPVLAQARRQPDARLHAFERIRPQRLAIQLQRAASGVDRACVLPLGERAAQARPQLRAFRAGAAAERLVGRDRLAQPRLRFTPRREAAVHAADDAEQPPLRHRLAVEVGLDARGRVAHHVTHVRPPLAGVAPRAP
jgi:hypothetical protein